MNVPEAIVAGLLGGILAVIGWFLSSIITKLEDLSRVVQSLAESRAVSGLLSTQMAESLEHIEGRLDETSGLYQSLNTRVSVIESKVGVGNETKHQHR